MYLSILGGKKTPETIFQGIASAGRYIQDAVADNLPIRYAPRLSYHLDDSLKKQAEIFKTIDNAMADTLRNEQENARKNHPSDAEPTG